LVLLVEEPMMGEPPWILILASHIQASTANLLSTTTTSALDGPGVLDFGLVWGTIALFFSLLVIYLIRFQAQGDSRGSPAEGAPLLGDSSVSLVVSLLDVDGRDLALETRRYEAMTGMSMKLVYFASLANSLDYAVKMPTINDYITSFGGSTLFFGITISAFMVGRTVFSMIIGAWADRRGLKEPFMFAQAVTILGELLYVSADSICQGCGTKAMLALSIPRSAFPSLLLSG
jgi:hypothetical protein